MAISEVATKDDALNSLFLRSILPVSALSNKEAMRNAIKLQYRRQVGDASIQEMLSFGIPKIQFTTDIMTRKLLIYQICLAKQYF